MSPTPPPPMKSFEEFWPYYLGEHSSGLNQWLHVAALLSGLACLAGAAWSRNWLWLPVGLVAGYGTSWVGHFFVQRNRPATFQHPLWSLRGDLRMVWRKLTGGLGR